MSISNYDRLQSIGEGTYGVVYKARDIRTSKTVALKRIHIDRDDEGVSASTIREVALLKQMKHPNIAKLHLTFFSKSSVYLVFEYCRGDLKQYMTKYMKDSPIKSFPMRRIKKLMHQLLTGLVYCHSQGILHRDLKPQNILINYKTEQLKLTDFGLSRAFTLPNMTWTHEVITLWYRPPEILMGCSTYSINVDIWSVGCIFAELLNDNKALFAGSSEITQLFTIFKKLGTPNAQNWPTMKKDCKDYSAQYPKWKGRTVYELMPRDDFDESAQDLLTRMLLFDPKQRITPKEALQHQWF